MSASSLHNRCILVTRPSPQGEALCKAIEAEGGNAFYLPTLKIIPPRNPLLQQKKIEALSRCDFIIFTSQHAVLQSAPWILAKGKAILQKPQIICVGGTTALTAKKLFLSNPLYPSCHWQSEGVLNLPALHHVRGKKIALIRGEGGRQLLKQELKKRGAVVISILAYRRMITRRTLAKVHVEKIDISIVTSNDIMRNLKKIMGQKQWSILAQKPMVVVGERMRKTAQELGVSRILCANTASNNDIMSILKVAKEQANGNSNAR